MGGSLLGKAGSTENNNNKYNVYVFLVMSAPFWFLLVLVSFRYGLVFQLLGIYTAWSPSVQTVLSQHIQAFRSNLLLQTVVY